MAVGDGVGVAIGLSVAALLTAGPAAPAPVKHAIAFGSSQSGRYLRTFLHEGMNADEQDRLVFDGMLPHIGSSRRGEFNLPHSVWVHTDNRVFVCDRENERVQIFSPEGEWLETWDNDIMRTGDLERCPPGSQLDRISGMRYIVCGEVVELANEGGGSGAARGREAAPAASPPASR